MKVSIEWVGRATVLIAGEKRVIVDPWKLKPGVQPVDVVLVT